MGILSQVTACDELLFHVEQSKAEDSEREIELQLRGIERGDTADR
jgi:hypothetical protein